ncbi:MAG TPA: hypothetical protein VKU19_13005 [Bryobacteraceae bacterium]|nr:hypothetical protein [Bryobacteraceae bacterium]
MASLVEKIADAVLYEGYLLYPYRSSAVKNRQRFNFGIVYPETYSAAGGGIEPCEMQTQCLAAGSQEMSLSVQVRCLRLVERTVGPLCAGEFVSSPVMEVEGRTYESWQEAAECELPLPDLHLGELVSAPVFRRFALPATRSEEPVRSSQGTVAGLIVRTQQPLECEIGAEAEPLRKGLFRVSVRIRNVTHGDASSAGRDAVLARSLLSAHTILHLASGEFVSSLDPPSEFQADVAACQNVGTWPVLAGEPGQRDTMLSSPIILYDYPAIAPESPGDLFDGAEIDEILSLRILTLTDEEKRAMCQSDERARRILERTESLPPEHFMKLHGVLRGMDTGKEAS